MEPRITTSELAYYVQRQFGIDPYDFAFEFFLRWLRADPEIFLHENRIQAEDFKTRANKERDAGDTDRTAKKAHRLGIRPDLFLTIDTPNGKPIVHDPGAMEAQEWVLCRSFVFNILIDAGGSNDKLGKIYDAKIEECRALTETQIDWWHLNTWDHEVYPLIADVLQKSDFNNEQWMTIHRITMTQGLAIRYCLKVHGEVPLKVQRDFQRKYVTKRVTGKEAGVPTNKPESIDYLKTLVQMGLHNLRPRGTNEAAEQICDIWEMSTDMQNIAGHIRTTYNEMLFRKTQKKS